MQRPKTQKGAQRLTGRTAALTRFISRAGDRSLLFFKAINKRKEFEWTKDFEQSFQELKVYLNPHSCWQGRWRWILYSCIWQSQSMA
ncbi:hypothetical protein LIER_25807 [Lithospermum erythrorhizon]|uniref:Uncharacterized protein n=1 Tax=Lithospermum erythrorhizon TaxID=34254 RepID=A0AAV3R966_LITER